ncbi:MAG: S-layer homology domain-containing protein [Candidatus Peribacteraceae bacterium]|nr:S-layer homology domain-containing protein [Candidatus Peribacteraceae bacterium]
MRSFRSLLMFVSGVAVTLAGTALGQLATESAISTATPTASMQMFPDVQKNTFFAPSVATMVRTGVVQGYNNGTFGPDDPVTRAQVTVMIDRYDKNVVQPMREQIERIRQNIGLGHCGDGIVQTGEQCDDANMADGDGCGSACLTEVTFPSPSPPKSACGNGKCEPSEMAVCPTCTVGATCKPCTLCPEDCTAICGNEICEIGEAPTCVTNCPVGNMQEGCLTSCHGGTCPRDCDALEQTDYPPQQIGGQKDAYGCYTSAGYSWCAAKQKCIRAWEEKCE